MRRERIAHAVEGRIEFAGGRWLWRCTACGKLAIWDGDWSYFGSFIEAEENRFLWVACSAACATKLSKKHGTPLNSDDEVRP